MRSYGALNPLGVIPMPPDTVNTLLIAGSSGQAMDWPSTLSQLVRFVGVSTVGAALNFVVNLVSTDAAAPSSGSSVTTGTSAASTGNNVMVNGEFMFQIPPWSTGFSVAALSSGYIQAQIWRK
jgi:putative flippase GtrA